MFTIDDLWKVFQVLQGEDVPTLGDSLKSIAVSEKAVTTTLFENVIDQAAYNSNDYNRLRNFLIDWYTSLKSVGTLQKEVSADLFSLPDAQLDELFQSFGFNHSTDLTFGDGIQLNVNKVNLFFDLVNLYKIKGTPESIIRILQYYGVNAKLYELWLKKGSDTELIFEPEPLNDGYEIPNLSYESMVENDPHWMMTEDQILQLESTNKINLPSKSPYFAVIPNFSQDAGLSIIQRKIQDQYDIWDSGGTPVQDCKVSILGETTSVLETYLCSIYIFNKLYDAGYSSDPSAGFLCYNGSLVDVADIITEYNEITSNPISRADRESKLLQYYDLFTRPRSTNFLLDKNTAGEKLALINPTLKTDLDNLYNSGTVDLTKLLASLLIDIGDWVNDNVSLAYLNIAYIVLGLVAFTSSLGNVINFFKPYRSRWITIEALLFNNRLTESVRVDDTCVEQIEETIIDYDTANSNPCCTDPILLCPDSTASFYSRETYDCGSYYDIGCAFDNTDKIDVDVDIEETINDVVICISDSTSVISNGSYDSTADLSIVTEIKNAAGYEGDNISEVYWQSGGFDNFDEGGTFDCQTGFDNCQILVQEL